MNERIKDFFKYADNSGIFDISDVTTNYVAFTFKIINIKERK